MAQQLSGSVGLIPGCDRDVAAPGEIGTVHATRLLDCVTDAIIVVDEGLRLRWHNAAFLRSFDAGDDDGEDAREDAGEIDGLADAIHTDDLERALVAFAALLEAPGATRQIQLRVRRGWTPQARQLWHPVEVHATNLLADPDIAGVVCCFRDLTQEEEYRSGLERQLELAAETTALQAQLAERQDLLTRLVRTQTTIATNGPLDDVCRAICAGVTEVLGDEIASLRLVDADGNLRLHAVCGMDLPGGPGDESRFALGGIGGRAFATGDEQAATFAAPPFADGPRAGFAVPIRRDGRVLGSLAVGTRRPDRHYSEAERDIMRLLADHAADALATAQVEARINLALTDELTGLPHRRAALDHLEAQLAAHRSRQEPLALLFVDLDGFKAINDSRGHEWGDRVLEQVAHRLRRSVRTADVCARLGGDEFLVICPSTDAERAAAVAERIAAAIGETYDIGGTPFVVGTTIGVATTDGHDADGVTGAPHDAEHMIRRADIAMYRGKTSGRNRIVRFHPTMEVEVVARVELEHQLRDAIRGDGLDVAFQPIIDLHDETTVGFEALARWTSPTQGPISPARFVALAQAIGLERELDVGIARAACRALAEHPGRPILNINVSPENLEDPAFADELIALARINGLDPDRLFVEVVESAELSATTAASTLGRLRAHGVRIAIDDFGTGYSSLSYLNALPIDMIKLDRSFVAMLEQPDGGQLPEALVHLAGALDLDVVAEGIESDAQLARLQEIGADFGQGYLLGRPGPLLSREPATATLDD